MHDAAQRVGRGREEAVVLDERERSIGDLVDECGVLGGADELVDPAGVDKPVLMQVQSRLAIEDAAGRVVDLGARDVARLDGLDDRADRPDRIERLEQGVVAGLDRHDADLLRAEAIDHLVVPEVVGRQHTLEAESTADPGCRERRFDAGRQLRAVGHRRHADVLGHDERDPGVDGVLERQEVGLFDLVGRLVIHRKLGAGHQLDVAAAGIVLGRREHAVVLIAADVGRGQPSEQVEVGAERADAEDRVVRLRLHVDDGRVGEVDADRAALGRADAADLVGQVLRADSGQRHVGGELRGTGELLARSTLEVGRHEERHVGFGLQPVQEIGRVVRRATVDDEPAHAVVTDERTPVLEHRVVIGDVLAAHLLGDELADLLLERQPRERLVGPPLGFLVRRRQRRGDVGDGRAAVPGRAGGQRDERG